MFTGGKLFLRTNALAYLPSLSVTKKKSFIKLRPGGLEKVDDKDAQTAEETEGAKSYGQFHKTFL